MNKSSYVRRQNKYKIFVIMLLILSMSFLFMPFGVGLKDKNTIPMFISGGLFWIGFIGTTVMALNINKSRRASPVFKELYPVQRQLGLIHFFQNKAAAAADITMCVAILGFVISKWMIASNYGQFAAISLFTFSFGMHCMLNGINYKYLNYR